MCLYKRLANWFYFCLHFLFCFLTLCKILTGNAMRADGGASFGEGSEDVLINNVQCVGNEATLQDCPHELISSTICDHGQDAGVVCSKSGKFQMHTNEMWICGNPRFTNTRF